MVCQRILRAVSRPAISRDGAKCSHVNFSRFLRINNVDPIAYINIIILDNLP